MNAQRSNRPARQRPNQAATELKPHVEDLAVGDQSTTQPDTSRVRAGSEGQPKYRQMIRSEARLRPDQLDALAQLRRTVNARREARPERITDNTLIRIAVDMLISQGDQLSGDTEDELRGSVIPRQTD